MEQKLQQLLDFLNESHSEYNAKENIKEILLNNNFLELDEKKPFNLSLGSKYFVTRNDNSVLAFILPEKILDYKFIISASHLDSPCLKVKMSKDDIKGEYHRVNIEKYGSIINSTWLDKPLSLCGRVFIKENETIVTKIIDINKPLLIIPNVCVHFNRDINEGFKYNAETDLKPLISLGNEENSVLAAIEKELKVNKDQIISYDLIVYNFQKGYIGGLNDELLMSQRIDNLESAFITLSSFIESSKSTGIKVYASFSCEEIGSKSLSGADSDFLKSVLERINFSLGYSLDEYYSSIAKSYLLSVDNGHAVHPNHPEYSDPNSLVHLNKGPIIKFNSNMAYLTDASSAAVLLKICSDNQIPYQIFYNKSDVRGGSTLGTLSISHLGIKTVDIGLAQLAMHSNYEVAGCEDVIYMYNLVKCTYEQF